MRKYLTIAAFFVIATVITITLSSNGTKERSDGGRDLVEELYDQAVKQNNNLESIEEDISKFYKKKNDALEKYNSYTYYNSRYYSDARAKTQQIADATIKQRATDQLNQSEAAYNARIAAWQKTIADMNARERELGDLHILLKIATTRPMIEKYQSNELPDNGKAREANDDLLKLVQRIKEITK